MRKPLGFTLLELMIVVAIVAILAAIAVPSYLGYARRGKRADAYAVLNQDQQILERCYAQYFAYNSNQCPDIVKTSDHGYYTVATSNLTSTTYTLTATATGVQAGDKECQTFSLDNTGARSATGSGGDTTAQCWK